MWNERRIDSTPFLRDYEQLLLRYGTDYNEVRHEHTAVGAFFDPLPFQERTFEMRQEFDYEGAKGRWLSSSYAPQRDDPRCTPMLEEMRRISDLHQKNGKVAFDYLTRLYFGRLNLKNE